MLGAVKGEGAAGGAPLFRVLARRWKSLAPVKRERGGLSSVSPKDADVKPTRAWIAKPRQYPDFVRPVEKKPRAWNPWLWMK
jgi:hypothetical protein